ncbi:signal peptidase I [Agromyces atrinae]|uniref:Signal peptidase I n=1 Tax=Agromyces atrinae TaxID=592376 RepID=A0A852SLZ4_9MICO|nr:signal peptidase I [Agromyces atrinae]NYD68727.1 signal peptidase [Agromyces atrinae]
MSAPTIEHEVVPVTESPRRGRVDVRDVIVTIVGSLGIIAVVWFAVSAALSLSIVVFVTGSMAPTMPTGTAAIVQTVAASELAVGDVVTVTRPDTGTQVTHRIVAIDPAASSDERALTLRGDDNVNPDRDRYVVSETGRVVATLPGAGAIALALRSPLAMTAITLGAALVVAWGLWPRRESRRRH